jgi:hypothetical protein
MSEICLSLSRALDVAFSIPGEKCTFLQHKLLTREGPTVHPLVLKLWW